MLHQWGRTCGQNQQLITREIHKEMKSITSFGNVAPPEYLTCVSLTLTVLNTGVSIHKQLWIISRDITRKSFWEMFQCIVPLYSSCLLCVQYVRRGFKIGGEEIFVPPQREVKTQSLRYDEVSLGETREWWFLTPYYCGDSSRIVVYGANIKYVRWIWSRTDRLLKAIGGKLDIQ